MRAGCRARPPSRAAVCGIGSPLPRAGADVGRVRTETSHSARPTNHDRFPSSTPPAGDRYADTPTQGVVYASPTDNGVFLADNLSHRPATRDWILYELVITADGVGTAYQNGFAIGTGPAAGPNVLRLGGGINGVAHEFGTGFIHGGWPMGKEGKGG